MVSENDSLWKELENTAVDKRVLLTRLESVERAPVFSGLMADNDTRSEMPVTVRFFPEEEPSTSIFDRHREAMFLSHPNLLACFGAGTLVIRESRFVYGVYERPDVLLATLQERKPLSPAEVRAVCLDVMAGLEYLHGLGLVYCTLDQTTVARRGDRWQLCDYSQLRPEGAGYSAETRRLLGTPGAPPEAFSGVVMPAWDCWSVAQLMRFTLAPRPPTRFGESNGPVRTTRPVDLPEPFQTIAVRCLVPDPGARCSIAEIRSELERPVSTPLALDGHVADPLEPIESQQPLRARLRRRALPILVAAAAALAILTAAAKFLDDPADRPDPQPGAATHSTASPQGQQPAGDTRSRLSTPPAVAETRDEAGVQRVIEEWADSFRKRDLSAQMSLYAPKLDRFFQARNVGTDFVRRTKESTLRQAGQIRRYEITNVDTQFTGPNAATVTFDKAWLFVGRTRYTGKVRGELKLEQHDGEWRIVSERDLKVYSQNRARS